MSSPALFSPIKVGNVTLQHRVVLAPLTRNKSAKDEHVPVLSLMEKYYSQRSCVPGTLLLTDATLIASEAGGIAYVPGIWSKDQITAWKKITDAVHANGSYIYLQLWALGRAAKPETLKHEGNHPYVSSSSVPLSHRPTSDPSPRPLTVEEIDSYVQLYVTGARNALEAGFDGVEVHGANGYLIDQFLQDTCNKRTDDYGGSVQNRSRFGLRVVDAVAKAVGEERTGVRLSPWGLFQDMRMDDPIPQFTHFVSALASSHPNLAYLHVVEPSGSAPEESNDFLRSIWGSRPFISCGGYTRESALKVSKEKGDIIAFGHLFISNPDLPFRLKHDIPLTKPDQSTFYTPSDNIHAAKGYIDYPFSDQFFTQPQVDMVHYTRTQLVEYALILGVAGLVAFQALNRWRVT